MREIALKLSALFLFLTIVIGTFAEISQPKEDKDGYIPKGEYNTCETRDLMPTYSEVLYSADAEVINSTWQNDGFSYSNGAFTTGNYNENQQFFASSPSFSLPIQRLGTHIYLRLDSEIDSESWYDVAYIKVVNLRTGESFTVYANHGIRARAIEYIDLGYFHGNEIRLDFSFSSDSSFHGKGWSIYEAAIVGDKLLSTSTPKLKSRIKAMNSSSEDNKMQEPGGGVSENGGIDVSSIYKGIKIQLISVNFKNGNEGTIGFTMTDSSTNEYYKLKTIDSSHFKVKVGGKEVPICGQVQENQHNNVDAVIALDCSGSMYAANNNLKNTIPGLLNALSQFSSNLAPVRFGADTNDVLIKDNFEFGQFISSKTYSANKFIQPASNLGNTELYYYNLIRIANYPKDYTFGSQKVIIMIGDESANYGNDIDLERNKISESVVVNQLKIKNFQTIIINKESNSSEFSDICLKTYGKYINLNNGNFDKNDVINTISNSLNARYYIDFCLSDTSFACLDTTNVSLEFNYENSQADSKLSLVEFAPVIYRSAETISYSDSGWKKCGDSLIVSFAVYNKCGNDTVQSAVVYYAFNNDSVFVAKAVNLTSNDTLSANIFIPDSVSKIDYRISVQMKNSRFIATSPQVTNTMGDTWTIPVCCGNNCNPLPSVMDVAWNCDSEIQVNVINAQNVESLQVYFLYNNEYKENVSAAQYTYVPLQLTSSVDSENKRIYSAPIPDEIQNKHIVYHVYMTDGNYKMWYGNGNETNKDMEVDIANCNLLCENFRLSANPITTSSDSVIFTLKKQTTIKFVLTDNQGNLIMKKEINEKNFKEKQENVEIKLSLLNEVFVGLNRKKLDPLNPYILTITDGKKAVMTYIYISRL